MFYLYIFVSELGQDNNRTLVFVLPVGGRAGTQDRETHQETVCSKVGYCVPRDQEESRGD